MILGNVHVGGGFLLFFCFIFSNSEKRRGGIAFVIVGILGVNYSLEYMIWYSTPDSFH